MRGLWDENVQIDAHVVSQCNMQASLFVLPAHLRRLFLMPLIAANTSTMSEDYYPLIPVIVTDSTNVRCAAKKITTMGAIIMVLAAIK